MALNQGAHQHRAGPLKQKNKEHKHGRHRTKGGIDRDSQGRVNVKTMTKKLKNAEKQAVRRNQAKQLRKLQRDAIIQKKRQRGGQHTPPHFVVVIGLSDLADCKGAVEQISAAVSEMEGGIVTRNEQGILHASIARFKQRVSFFIPPPDSLHGVLDAAKVADSILFVASPDFIDDHGDLCIKCLMSQGMPSATFVYRGMADFNQKKMTEMKKMMMKELEKRFPVSDSKMHSLQSEQDAILIVRKLTEGKTRSVQFREIRPHLIAESLSFEAESAEASEGTLCVSGYVRGADLSADRLVHVVGWGTYQLKQIASATDPHPLVLGKQRQDKASSMETAESVEVLAVPTPEKQVSLESEAEVDPMQGEQTWPTQDELQEADDLEKRRKLLKKTGVSEYQATWLHDSDLEDDDDDDDDDEEEEEEGGEAMEADSDEESWESCSEGEDTESVAMTETNDDQYDVHFDEEAERRQLQQLKEERMNAMFPDEVDTPHDSTARERFARYRGLSSFRTSPWHKNEELPTDYQRIYRLGDMRALKKKILKAELTNSVMSGQYITLHIKGVPKAFMESYRPSSPLVVFGLLPCEQLMSVVHLAIKRDGDCDDTVKSKTRLSFQVGFRRFSACPIFSECKRGDKHKMERFLPYDGVTVASVYAPATFGPCPVLVFNSESGGQEQLVATGSLHSVNPDRIVLKRVILSGHPFKTNKRKSVVRFMFFNREDIEWFKSIELRTKWNRRGRITEPVGTHGHMKCHFNGKPMSQDVVLMYLYKRAYPKWTYQPEVPNTVASILDSEEKGQAFEMFD